MLAASVPSRGGVVCGGFQRQNVERSPKDPTCIHLAIKPGYLFASTLPHIPIFIVFRKFQTTAAATATTTTAAAAAAATTTTTTLSFLEITQATGGLRLRVQCQDVLRYVIPDCVQAGLFGDIGVRFIDERGA